MIDNRVRLSELVALEAGMRMRGEDLAAKGVRRLMAYVLAQPEDEPGVRNVEGRQIVIDLPVTGLKDWE